MKRDPVKEYMKETRKKSLAGTLGPDLDEEIRQRVIANAKRYAAEQHQAEWEQYQARRAKRRKLRPAIAVVMVACLLMAVPMFAFGNKSGGTIDKPVVLTTLPEDYHFYLETQDYPLLSMEQRDRVVTSYYSLQGQRVSLALVESHENIGGYTLAHDNDPKGYSNVVPFYGVTLDYYVDRDGVTGYVEFPSQDCCLKISTPTCTEEEFLDIVSHIQRQ